MASRTSGDMGLTEVGTAELPAATSLEPSGGTLEGRGETRSFMINNLSDSGDRILELGDFKLLCKNVALFLLRVSHLKTGHPPPLLGQSRAVWKFSFELPILSLQHAIDPPRLCPPAESFGCHPDCAEGLTSQDKGLPHAIAWLRPSVAP